ncbi:hypothetical protein ACJMK2_042607 [Sinanodonta woodiana]|uniref:Uncharacterized protein n=1 Tax=Sinanodonta woodiana TaxID=1069815 RepID=A0ABD3W7W0_SINWO
MAPTFIYIFTLVFCLFITSVTPKSLLPSYWSKEVMMKRKNVEKACVPFCKVFSTVCNYGECRQKLETDCEWYCECPPDCVGRFCEKLIKPEESTSTSNTIESKGSATNMTLVKETTKVPPPMENIDGNASKSEELSICPPEMIKTRLNGTNDTVLESSNITNNTENESYSSYDEKNRTTLAVILNLTKTLMISDTTPAQSINNTTMQQSLLTDASLQSGTTVKLVSTNEHITERNSTFSGFTSFEKTVFTSTEQYTRQTNDLPSEKRLRTETSTLLSLLNNSPGLRSFNANETSSRSTASAARQITTPSHVISSTKHDFNESDIGTSQKLLMLPITPKTVNVVTTEQKQVAPDTDFSQNGLNSSSNVTSMSKEDRDIVTLSGANFTSNVSNGGSDLETDGIKQLSEASTERTSSPFISTSMPDQLSLTHITNGRKASDQTTDKSSIILSISQETTPVTKDEINTSDIEMRTNKVGFNLAMRTSEYSSTTSMKILQTDVFPTTTPLLNTMKTVVDQPISNLDIRSVEFKVPSGENSIDNGESVEVQNSIENTTWKIMSSSFGPAASSNHSDKVNKSNVETTTINTITDAFTRKYITTTVDQKLQSIENSKDANLGREKNVDSDFKVRLKDIKPESNSLAQSKTDDSLEVFKTGKESPFAQ